MNPLQVFCLMFYESDPGAAVVSLDDFWHEYRKQRDGTEHQRWWNREHVLDVLARAFPIVDFGGRLMIGNISPKRMDWPYISRIEDLEVAA